MSAVPAASDKAIDIRTDRARHARRVRNLRVAAAAAAIAMLFAVAILAIGTGSFHIPARRVVAILLRMDEASAAGARDALILWNIRLPRVLLAALVGAALAVSGAVMQGLFRNPLADPGLVGVSSGSALAAALTIVLADGMHGAGSGAVPFGLLPVGAFFGGLLTTAFLYVISTRNGRTSVATMLLAGIALAAMAGSMMGFLSFISDDRQLRDLTFWSLGSLGGANWSKVVIVGLIITPLLLATPFLARGLNALLLGESEAYFLGFHIQRTKFLCILLVAAAVGAGVAAAGVIGFVGIVVPHVVRLLLGPDHRILLPLSALLGAILLMGADIVARIVVAPAELPIGILTAAIGSPFFLWLLLRRRQGGSL